MENHQNQRCNNNPEIGNFPDMSKMSGGFIYNMCLTMVTFSSFFIIFMSVTPPNNYGTTKPPQLCRNPSMYLPGGDPSKTTGCRAAPSVQSETYERPTNTMAHKKGPLWSTVTQVFCFFWVCVTSTKITKHVFCFSHVFTLACHYPVSV